MVCFADLIGEPVEDRTVVLTLGPKLYLPHMAHFMRHCKNKGLQRLYDPVADADTMRASPAMVPVAILMIGDVKLHFICVRKFPAHERLSGAEKLISDPQHFNGQVHGLDKSRRRCNSYTACRGQMQTPTFPPGWRVFPCHAGMKEPIHAGWPLLATDDPAQIATWAEEYPGCNWAVAAGPSGLAIVDIDGAIGEDSLAAFELETEFLPATREHRSARGGRHLIYRGDCAPSVAKLGPHLDTRGRNSYIVIPPSTFEGGSYELVADRPLTDLPECIREAAGRRREAVQAAEGITLDNPIALARGRRLLKDYVASGHVAVEGSGGDALTYAVCAEVISLGLTPDAAFDLIDTVWNVACDPPWDPEELRVKIENASAYAQNEPGAWAVLPVRDRIPSDALDKLIAESAPVTRQGERARFAWMDEAEFSTMPPPEWLIPDMLTTKSIAMIYGPSGSYKSFLALNIAAQVAQHGQAAFYVAAEGITRMARMDYPAWKLAYAEERKLPFYMVEDMPLASQPGDLDAFADSIKTRAGGQKVGIIFLDTLNNAMIGLEENSATDAATMLAACKALKRTFGCTVVVVHHTPADGTTPRGSSALFAGFDTVLKVVAKPEIKLAQIWVSKQKTAEAREYPWSFEGHKVGPGLAFTPIEPKVAAAMHDDANIFGPKSISRSLAKLKAFGPDKAVSSQVLLMQLVPQLENETTEQRNTSLSRASRQLTAAVKDGKLDAFYEGFNRTVRWFVPAPKDEEF